MLSARQIEAHPKRATRTGSIPADSGLKPKDLCMIPARVALALQQPRYTGRLALEGDRRWLAAMIDGEGCIYISRSKEGSMTGRGRLYQRTQDAFDIGVKVTNTNLRLIEAVSAAFGHGNIREAANHGRTAYDVALYSSRARDLLREVYPYLVAKQHEARLAIGCPPSGEIATSAHEALKLLHHGSDTTVDFPAPKSMFEPGWWLRSAVTWCKRAPMPESVEDRPTSATEQIFMLSKSAAYFYDRFGFTEPSVADHPSGNGYRRDEQLSRGGPGQDASWQPQATRNMRNYWVLGPEPYPAAHFAVFPSEIPRRAILLGTSERGVCAACGAPWGRVVERASVNLSVGIEGNPTYLPLIEKRLRQGVLL